MSFLGDIFQVITGLDDILNAVDTVAQDGESLVQNVKSEITKVKNFKHDPKWKSRVINVPAAITKSKQTIADLAQQVYDALHVLISNLKALRGSHISDPRAGGGGGVASVLHLITSIRQFVILIDDTIKNLASFVDALRKVTEEFQTLDSIFLQQGNSRQKVHDASPTIRIGKLHAGD